ncbi:3,4-dihydroxy-2-butanone-4-phosphate synthase [Gammaproteobacteria bacterium]|nr:3,4-dihydroxy-2-butanone-4-phosphate synthase [Gammaproteobacteria bacterium]MDC1150315.1 3,4-dihydroxy-2-butanone-4-phosphate synthase [Gammaproteobacteria bacterium]
MLKDNIKDIIQDIRKGKMVIILDDESRENEGDLVCAAEMVTPEIINFMASKGKGLICLPLCKDLINKFDLKMMTNNNKASNKTAFTVSIEAAEGITTGISAADRAHTIKTVVNKNSKTSDIVQPGHIFPLKAMEGGVLSRAGHTEAACDLAKLAGFQSAGVICEVMNDDGTMARRDDLIKFGNKHDIKVGTIADLIDFRLSLDSTIEAINEKTINNEFGEFKLIVWKDNVRDEYHFSLTKGDLSKVESPLVRVQTQSILQDTLGIEDMGKNWSIRKSIERISKEEAGLFVLINHRDAKSYWLNKLEDKEIEPKRNRRVIGVGSQICRALNLKKITVLGTPTKYNAVSGFNIEITGFVNE